MLRGPVSTIFYGMYCPIIDKMADRAAKSLQYYYENYRRNSNAQYYQTSIQNSEGTTVKYRLKS